MRKYNIEFKDQKPDHEDFGQYQDFDKILNNTYRHISRRRLYSQITATVAMLTIPVLIAFGYMNPGFIRELFQKEEEMPEVENIIIPPAPATPAVKEEIEKITIPATNLDAPAKSKTKEETKPVEEKIEEEVIFALPIGGYEALSAHFNDLSIATKGNLEKITVTFMINTSGRPERISIVEEVSPFIEKQVIDAVSNMPDWEPAKSNGKPFKSTVSLPIVFKYN